MNKTISALKLAEEALNLNLPIGYCVNGVGDKSPMYNSYPLREEKTQQALAAIREAVADHIPDAAKKVAEHKCGGCAKTAADGWALYCVECWEKADPEILGKHTCLSKTTEALKLAEEWLENYGVEGTKSVAGIKCTEALAAIREALTGDKLSPTDHSGDANEMVSEPLQEPVGWINEDELPEYYPYDEMFQASRIIDGVRMFPNVKMSDRSMFYGLTKDHTWLSITESQFNKLKPEARMKCYLAPVDAKAIRAEALEEAAKVCDEKSSGDIHDKYDDGFVSGADMCAAAIRGLK